MPWVKNENREDVYKPSIFVKEDLPTWNEFYYEFCINMSSCRRYDSDNEYDEEDKYWIIPRRLYLLATACNQLNKMLWEDGMMDKVIDYIYKVFNMKVDWISFILIEDKDIVYDEEGHICISSDSIYETIGREKFIESFIGDREVYFMDKSIKRFDITRCQQASMVIKASKSLDYGDATFYIDDIDLYDDKIFYMNSIIDFMVQDIKKYFENGIGWKDIESSKEHKGCVTGFDPAL